MLVANCVASVIFAPIFVVVSAAAAAIVAILVIAAVAVLLSGVVVLVVLVVFCFVSTLGRAALLHGIFRRNRAFVLFPT